MNLVASFEANQSCLDQARIIEVLENLSHFDKHSQWLHYDLTITHSNLIERIVFSVLSIFPDLRNWLFEIDHERVSLLLCQLKPQADAFGLKAVFNQAVLKFEELAERHMGQLSPIYDDQDELARVLVEPLSKDFLNHDILTYIFEFFTSEEAREYKKVSKAFYQASCIGVRHIVFKKPPSIENLRSLTKYPGLTSLDFSRLPFHHRNKIDDTFLASITPYLKDLKELKQLNLQSCSSISRESLDHITSLKQLKELDISQCNEVLDEGLLLLARINLASLKLSSCRSLTEKGIGYVDKITSLVELDLSNNQFINDEVIRGVANSLLNLGKLNLEGCRLSDEGLEVLSSMQSLKHLNIGGYKPGITNDGLDYLNRLVHLETLIFCSSRVIDDRGFARLTALKSLKELSLYKCKHISDLGFEAISNLSALKKLSIIDFDILTNRGLKSLRRLTHLASLTLSCNWPDVNDEGFVFLDEMSQLEHLNLRFSMDITDLFFTHLKASKLKTLRLTGSDKLTAEAFSELVNLPQLHLFKIFFRNVINDRALQYLSQVSLLSKLDLSGSDSITDVGLEYISRLTHLKKLYLNGCKAITDEGIKFLERLEKLEKLSVQACVNITDNALRSIKKLQKLQWLNLSGCINITKEGVLVFKDLKKLMSLDLKCCPNIESPDIEELHHIDHLMTFNILQNFRVRTMSDD